MKTRSILPVVLFILSFSFGFAQKPDEKILMTVAGRGVEAGEFIRMYNKSLDPAFKTDLNEYLDNSSPSSLRLRMRLNKVMIQQKLTGKSLTVTGIS